MERGGGKLGRNIRAGSMRRDVALYTFGFASALALAAFFYNPPLAMEKKMNDALEKQAAVHLQIDGQVSGVSLHLDLAKRGSQTLLRLAYQPLKILNNQWIAMPESPSARAVNVFQYLRLTRRRTSFGDLLKRREKYVFAFSAEAKAAFGNLLEGEGEIAIDARSGLPIDAQFGKHSEIDLAASGAGFPVFQVRILYADPFANISYAPPRRFEDILGQLDELVKMNNGKPHKIPPLADLAGDDRTAEFENDFDRDGLSDALEVFYGTDPTNPDSDDDAFLDGEEVERGFSPVGEGRLTPDR